MATKNKVIPATSMDVRTWFEKNPRKVPPGAEKSVKTSCRGLIKEEAVEVFNAASKSHGMRYDKGNEPHIALTYKARNHRQVTVHLPKSQVRALAGKAGKRGPLSQKDMLFAAEVYASTK